MEGLLWVRKGRGTRIGVVRGREGERKEGCVTGESQAPGDLSDYGQAISWGDITNTVLFHALATPPMCCQ